MLPQSSSCVLSKFIHVGKCRGAMIFWRRMNKRGALLGLVFSAMKGTGRHPCHCRGAAGRDAYGAINCL